MKKAEKIAEAKAVLAEAQRLGCVVSLSDSGGGMFRLSRRCWTLIG